MKQLKKVLSVFLAALMLFSVVPLTASASVKEGSLGDNITYYYDSDIGILTISGTGKMYNYSSSNGLPWVKDYIGISPKEVVIEEGITSIGSHVFDKMASIKSISIPESVTSIGENAFYMCNGLTEIKLPSKLTDIGDYAFDHCTALTSIVIPDGVKVISYQAFYNCTSLKTVTLGAGVTSIASKAFNGCKDFETIYIGKNLKSVGWNCFTNCGALTDVYYEGTEEEWKNISFDNYNEDVTKATNIHYNYHRHTYTSEITKEPTYSTEGEKIYTCVCGDSYTEVMPKLTYKAGDIIEFGSYPQTEVKDEALITELNALAPEWEDWTSYNYYSGKGSGTMASGNWMRYTDISYNGYKYRGVKFTQYRPGFTTVGEYGYDYWGDYAQQKDNQYYTDTVYWFKFESIKWRILDSLIGLLLCETIIDAQAYSNTVYSNVNINDDDFNDPNYTNYANDYETSSIRKWLNKDFYSVAFTNIEKDEIKITTLNNDGYYTTIGVEGYEKFDSSVTNDRIFLLSYSEATNSDYGFASGDECDVNRLAKGSDYARSQNLLVNYTEGDSAYISPWLTRTAGERSGGVSVVVDTGEITNGNHTHLTIGGVRPAITLDLAKYTCTHEWESTSTPATCIQDGVTTYTCNLCGSSYAEEVPATGHTYTSAVTAPTCTADGYTTYTCVCGHSYVSDTVKAEGHKYTSEITTPATHLTEGVETFTCKCGDSYTKPVAKLTEHSYEKAVTAPTCTVDGYTTYTCACGDTYVSDYVKAEGHKYTSEITTPATHLAEGVETFTCACGDSYTKPVAKLEEHSYEKAVTAPTCTVDGFTTYTCACGDTYVSDYVKAEGHKYTSEITTPATHLAEGVETFTCKCGDSYTEPVAKLTEHSYEKAVTAPTCTVDGFTTYTCACGDTYVSDYVEAEGHKYTSEITTPATHLTEGVETYTCKCGDTYTEPVAKLEGHTYTSEVTKEATHLEEGETTYTCACGDSYTKPIAKLTEHSYKVVVTAPTCTEKGYTTYICECGKSYVSDYVGTKEHSYTSAVTTPATHLKEGVITYTCSACGTSYTGILAKLPGHTYSTTYVVAPTCKAEGYTAHVCDCGDIMKDNFTERTTHSFSGRVCVNCGFKCSCMCHYGGIMDIIWKIVRFIYKLFGANKVCECGLVHY